MSIRNVVKLIALIMMLVVTGCSGTMNVSVINMISVTKPAPVGNPVRGEDIYKHGVNEAPACVGCHALTKSAFSLGPVLTGISERAGKRIEGMSADDYLRHSILDPNAYVVSGFRAMMFPGYAKHLNEQDVLDLIAYLKTL